MARPYLYHYAQAYTRSHKLSQAIARKELDKAGFAIASAPAAWERFTTNAYTIAVVTNVPLAASKTYVHVLATSNASAPGKKWAAAIHKAIKESKLTLMTDWVAIRRLPGSPGRRPWNPACRSRRRSTGSSSIAC